MTTADLGRRSPRGIGLVFSGTVVHGDARGRTLGFPTANLDLAPSSLLPPDGVWAARVVVPHWTRTEDLIRTAALSVGTNPTYGGTTLRVEAHLLDFDGDLYGRPMTVYVLDHLRTTRRFDTEEQLVQQIAADVLDIRRWSDTHGSRAAR